MAAHAVACDANSIGVYLVEGGKHCLREFLRDVGVHIVVGGPGVDGGVDVESSSVAKVPVVVFAFDSKTPLVYTSVSGRKNFPGEG